MSAFRPRNLSPADLSALATDPDLVDSEARLAVVLATRASQASVDNLGSTLGPAITAATADKATAAQVESARVSLSAAISSAFASTLTPGEIRMVSTPDGVAPAGTERISGITVPRDLFTAFKCVTVPMRAGNPLFTSAGAGSPQNWSNGFNTVTGDYYLLDGLQAAAGKKFVALNVQTGAFRSLASHPHTSNVSSICPVGNVPGDHITASPRAGAGPSGVAFRYVAVQNAWASIANAGLNRACSLMLPLEDGRVLRVGGYNSTSTTAATMTADARHYNPVTNEWTDAPAAPFRVEDQASALIAPLTGTGLCFVRCRTSDGTTLSTGNWLVNPEPNTWTAVEAVPAGYSDVLRSPMTVGPGQVAFESNTSPEGVSRGLLYDATKPIGSRWSPFDLGESVGSTQSSTLLFGAPCYAGSLFGWGVCWRFATNTAAEYQPVLVRLQDVPAASTSTAFYVRKP